MRAALALQIPQAVLDLHAHWLPYRRESAADRTLQTCRGLGALACGRSAGTRFSASSLVTVFWQVRRQPPAFAGRIPAAVCRAAKAVGKD